MAFVGNGLNTLSISAAKIDTNLLVSGSVWWEPLGDYARTRQIGQHVRRLFCPEKGSHSTWYLVYKIAGGSFFKSRSIKS